MSTDIVLPSQVSSFIGAQFPDGDFDHGTALQLIGAVAALLELFERIPTTLFRLTPEENAQILASMAGIKLAVDRYRSGSTADTLRTVGRNLQRVRPLIARLPDHVPSQGQDLNFITDPILREMIGLDMSAVESALANGEWKAATIIAGSCCEALLLYGLQHKEKAAGGTIATACAAIDWQGPAPLVGDLLNRSWNLFAYGEVAHHLQIISSTTKTELKPSREYRNLIHPAKSMRLKMPFDRGTAFVGAGALEHVVSDLRKNLN
jgi:hypothetical protein